MARLHLLGLGLLLLLDLEQQGAVDVWQHTTKGDSGTDQGVELFVATDGELQVARCDTLDLEVLGGIACELEDFGSQVLENSSNVDSSLGADTHLVLGVCLEETLDTTAGELKTSASRVALLFLGTLSSGRRLPARALSARRLSLASGHVCIDYGLWMMASDGWSGEIILLVRVGDWKV